MSTVNLIPIDRQRARRLSNHVRRWGWGCCVYGALLSVVFLVMRVSWSDGHMHLQASLGDYKSRIAQTTTDMVELRRDMGQLAAELRAANAVGSQPDWSILMALVTRTLDDEIVLRTCKLSASVPGLAGRSQAMRQSGSGQRNRGPSRQTDSDEANDLWLMLSGFGRNQPAVAQFVLRLEQEEIFSEVKLLDTQREPFLAEQAVAFRIGCALNIERNSSDATP